MNLVFNIMRITIIVFLVFALSLSGLGQGCPSSYNTTVSTPNSRQWNPSSMYTILYDAFNGSSLNTDIWDVRTGCVRNADEEAQHYKNNSNNVAISNGSLKLTARKETTYDWIYPQTGNPYWGSRDYTSGEIYTKAKTFDYGEYTIRCRFPVGSGSWAAFWVYGAPSGQPNEIDFFEQNKREDKNGQEINNVFHWYYQGGTCGPMYDNFPVNVNDWHIYRCRWTPYETKFYIDDMITPKKKWSRYESYTQYGTLIYARIEDIISGKAYSCNANYPIYPGEVILNYALKSGDGVVIDDTKIPQPFEIDYIIIKKFMLIPAITGSSVFCSTGVLSLDADPAVLDSNVSWELTPSNLFTGAILGTGKVANISASPSSQGKGKITYTYTVGNIGETYTVEKEIWINGPDANDVSFDVYRSDGVRATKVGSTFLMCPNTTYHIYVMNNSPVPLSNYAWTVPSAWTQNYTSGNMISVYTNSSPGGPVTVNATNTASGCNNTMQIITGYMGSNYSCGSYYMALSPNPSSGETSLILSADGEKKVDENTEWEIQIYDQLQGIKEMKTKIKGKQTKINTSNWKEGVYIVSAIIDGEMVSEKLLVKH